MLIDAHKGDRGKFYDRETGAHISAVVRADTEAGWLERYALDADGEIILRDNAILKVREKRSFVFFRAPSDPIPEDLDPSQGVDVLDLHGRLCKGK